MGNPHICTCFLIHRVQVFATLVTWALMVIKLALFAHSTVKHKHVFAWFKNTSMIHLTCCNSITTTECIYCCHRYWSNIVCVTRLLCWLSFCIINSGSTQYIVSFTCMHFDVYLGHTKFGIEVSLHQRLIHYCGDTVYVICI